MAGSSTVSHVKYVSQDLNAHWDTDWSSVVMVKKSCTKFIVFYTLSAAELDSWTSNVRLCEVTFVTIVGLSHTSFLISIWILPFKPAVDIDAKVELTFLRVQLTSKLRVPVTEWLSVITVTALKFPGLRYVYGVISPYPAILLLVILHVSINEPTSHTPSVQFPCGLKRVLNHSNV